MVRLLLILGLPVIVALGAVAFFVRTNNLSVSEVQTKQVPSPLAEEATSSKVDLSKSMEQDIVTANQDTGFQTSMSALEDKIKTLEKKIDELSKKQTTQPVVSTQTTTPTTQVGAKSVYIPIGYGGSGSSSTDFGTVSGHEVTIDPASYSGYKQMVFETSFRIFQGNGTGEVRLFNKTDGTAILGSVVSTTSQDYSSKTSSGFTLPGGSKTYTVQTKSSTGYSVDLQLTRVRVDF